MSIRYLLVVPFIFFSCSGHIQTSTLSKKQKVKYYKSLLQKTRPLLNSDELPYMDCKKLSTAEVTKVAPYNDKLWSSLGDLDLRAKAVEVGANIMSLSVDEVENGHKLSADLYTCERVNQVSEVDIAGMCKSSEERVFRIKYDPQELREVGEEILKTKIEYYALSRHYRSFHYRDIKYRYSKKEFVGKAYFFKCY